MSSGKWAIRHCSNNIVTVAVAQNGFHTNIIATPHSQTDEDCLNGDKKRMWIKLIKIGKAQEKHVAEISPALQNSPVPIAWHLYRKIHGNVQKYTCATNHWFCDRASSKLFSPANNLFPSPNVTIPCNLCVQGWMSSWKGEVCILLGDDS